MTIARKNSVVLSRKNGLWTVNYPSGSITVTCKNKANRIFDQKSAA